MTDPARGPDQLSGRTKARIRLATTCACLCGAIGVLFGTTPTLLVLFSAAGFVIGGGIGFLLGVRVRYERAIEVVRQGSRLETGFLIAIGWLLVGLGAVALIVNGWSLKIALITGAFLVAAILVTFHKGTRAPKL